MASKKSLKPPRLEPNPPPPPPRISPDIEIGPKPPALPSRRRRKISSGLPIRSKLVIVLALVRVGEDFVGLLDFLELVLSSLVVGVDVGVILSRKLPVRLLDLVRARGSSDSERFVIILKLKGHRLLLYSSGRVNSSFRRRNGDFQIETSSPSRAAITSGWSLEASSRMESMTLSSW